MIRLRESVPLPTAKGSIHTLWSVSVSQPDHEHGVPAAIMLQDSGTGLQIHFYISLGRTPVPVRINVIASLQWPGSLSFSLSLEVSLFLASFPSCPGNNHQIEITGSERSSLFMTKEKGSHGLRYGFLLLVSTGWQHCFERGPCSQHPSPHPPTHPPHCKISPYFWPTTVIHVFCFLGFVKCTELS